MENPRSRLGSAPLAALLLALGSAQILAGQPASPYGAASTPAGPAPVENSGQDSCWSVKGQESGCSGTGQDGQLQAGVDWPTPRFRDNGDGTVTDRLTRLIWLKWANCYDRQRWVPALSAVANLQSGGCELMDGSLPGDWRLPNARELESLVDYQEHDPPLVSGHPFTSVQTGSGKGYWSSTTYAINPLLTWVLLLGFPPASGGGDLTGDDKDNGEYSVWPVRGVSAGADAALILQDGGIQFPDGSVQTTGDARLAPVEATGQGGCFDSDGQPIDCAGTGQDGERQAGLSWPSPRFAVNGDGSVLDRLTGLIWLEDADCIAPRMWSTAVELASGTADGTCGLIDGSEPGDWRLPSVRELASLIDFGESSPAVPVDHPFGDLSNGYWSSSTVIGLPTEAWEIRLGTTGGRATTDKGFVLGVWPVRGGAE